MRRRALAIVVLVGVLGVVACTTFGGESEETTPAPASDAAPDTASADGPVDDGGLPGDDGAPPPIDSGPPAAPSACKGRCGPGTVCTAGDTCVVEGQPSCGASPIVVDQPGRYLGRICKAEGSKQTDHCGEQRLVHTFQITGTMSTVTVRPLPGSNLQFSVDPTCGAGTCKQVLSISGSGATQALSTNDFLTIGLPLCGNYELVFTK